LEDQRLDVLAKRKEVYSYVFLENMKAKDGKTKFSSYVFLNDEKNKAFASKENPETFVKYGQYEMCIRDRILIEAGYVTKATVKWWRSGYAYPYLWKENKSDAEYRESWGDPRLPKVPEEEQKVKPPVERKKSRGRKM
jgi:hypothetical protein